jgi:hypothetical protein
MDRLAIKRCRELMGDSAEPIPDDQILDLRDMLYELAGIMIDAYSELGPVSQDVFSYPGIVIDDACVDSPGEEA